jgi:hypothetical protein
MAQCKGPDAWYRIQVPEEQRIAYAKVKGIEYVPKTPDGGKKKTPGKGRRKDPEDVHVETTTTSKKVVTEMVTTTVMTVSKTTKKSRANDAALWTRASDEDYE